MAALTGIYRITHVESGRAYVGQSLDIKRRITDHKRGGRGYLAHAITKYGWSCFVWEVLELCCREALNEREAYWVATLGTLSPNGFNLTTGGGALTKVSEETRARIAAGGRGRIQSPEVIARRVATRAANPDGRGYRMKPETIAKRQATRRERGIKPAPWTDERRAAKSEQMKGRVPSAEARANLSAALKGRTRSPETCAAISAGLTGKKLSPERVQKMREAAKKRGPEWRQKISETKKRRNAEKRALESKQQEIDLIEIATAFGAERGVVWSESEMEAA